MSIDFHGFDPIVVEKLVSYMYTLNYDDGSSAKHWVQIRENKPLSLNYEMYLAGDWCHMYGLKELAQAKFAHAQYICWDK